MKYYLYLLSLIVLLSACNKTTRYDIYLPKAYIGEVAIIYDCKSGADSMEVNGRLQFTIPDSGVLLTKVKSPEEGILDQRFYMKTNVNNQEEIETYIYQKDTTHKYIYFDRNITTECQPQGEPISYTIKYFYVGYKMDLVSNKKRYFFENHIDSLIGCPQG
jgi:hypothetical protein